jgi:hypothetical protein
MATTPKLVGPSDPALLKSFENQTPSVARTSPPTVSTTGTATSTGGTVSRSIAPRTSGDTTTFNQATQASSGTELFIVSSNNNDSNDIVTVYNTEKQISVSAVNQTINNYRVTNSNSYGNSNVAAFLPTYDGNLSSGNLVVNGVSDLGSVSNVRIEGGTAGQILSTNGSGVLVWSNDSSGIPGGVNTQVQFNDTSAFAGNTGFTFNKTTGTLAAPFADVSGVANIVGGGATVATKSVLNVASTFGSNDANDPASAQAIRGRVTGSNLTKTRNYVTGVTGQYLVTGTNASEFIKAGVLGVVGDQTTTADGAVVAYLDGDGGLTTANAAYAVSMKNSTPNSGFNYGLDLQFIDLNVAGTTTPFKQADIRFNNGVELVANTAGNISINANVTVGNIIATNIGNIANINLDGSNSNVLYGNGVFAPATGSANTGNWEFIDNTMYNMAGGEINNGDTTHGATAGLVLPENGNAGLVTSLFNTYGNVQIAVANLANTANTSVWNFGVDGNLTLPNVANVSINYANGSPYGGGGSANTGNVTFDNINVIGTGNLNLQPDPADAGAYLDIFISSGPDIHLVASQSANLILGKDDQSNVMTSWDGNVYIQSWDTGTNTQGGVWAFNNGDINIPPNAASYQSGRIQSANGYPTLMGYGSGSHGGPELNWMNGDDPNIMGTSNVLRNTLYLNGDEGLYVGMNENVVANTFTGSWRFTPQGTTIFPTLEVDIHNGGVQSAQTLQFGTPGQQAIIAGPAPGSSPGDSAPRLIIQGHRGNGTGEGGDVYVWAGDADTNGGDIKIYAGDADNVSSGTGGYINLAGGDGFDNGGGITLNGGISSNGVGGQVSMTGGSGELNGGYASLQGGFSANGQGGAVQIAGGGGNSQAEYGNVEIGSGTYTWLFDNTGNVRLPGNTFAVNYANGTQVSIGGGNGTPGGSNTQIQFNDSGNFGANSGFTFDSTTGNIGIPGIIIGSNTVEIDNRASGNGADINLYSADDITLQARDRDIGSTSEGGDINIYAGDSAEDGDTSAGDINIEAGRGGASNIDFGGSGGFVSVSAGQGGAAVGANISARSGGSLTLNAGNAGGNNGNIDLGNSGGDVTINAGDSTGNGDPGGSIILRSGDAGANALAGQIQLIISSSDNGDGGTWTFDGAGIIQLPNNGTIGNEGNNIDIGSTSAISLEASSAVNIYTDTGTAAWQWQFQDDGNLRLPTIELDIGNTINEQTVIQSQRKIIPGLRYSAEINGTTPTVVYTATSVDTTSMKVTMQIQHTGLGFEFFDVSATSTGGNTFYTVSNRVQPPTIDNSTVVVDLNGSNIMEITVTINSGAANSWVTYDATEFGIAVD